MELQREIITLAEENSGNPKTNSKCGSGTIFYDDPIYVNYAGDRILEDDIVGIYGQVKGIKQYTAVLGNAVSVPEINSLLLEVITKGN